VEKAKRGGTKPRKGWERVSQKHGGTKKENSSAAFGLLGEKKRKKYKKAAGRGVRKKQKRREIYAHGTNPGGRIRCKVKKQQRQAPELKKHVKKKGG